MKTSWHRSIRTVTHAFQPASARGNHTVTLFSDESHQVFFGYYDVTPFSGNNRYLLAMQAPLENASPRPDSELIVGYYTLENEEPVFNEIDRTTTWCWQQGCRLQWYPAISSQDVLYNRMIDDQYGCVVQNIKSSKPAKTFKRPIYAVSNDGKWGISLNFSRLQRLRPGYGYVNFPDATEGQPAPSDDGLWRIDMHTGDERFLFSIEEITRFEPLESMNGADHYFNHVLFNPEGTRFMFFHVWVNRRKRFVRLITCNVDGGDYYALVNEGHVSHYTWKSDRELLAYSTHEDTGRKYHLYKDRSGERRVVGEGVLDQDGHPSFSPDGTVLLTDTYPDKFREQHLLMYTIKSGDLRVLGSYFSPVRFSGEVRCDLHPRWSPSGRYVCIDSPWKNKRAMYVFDLHIESD